MARGINKVILVGNLGADPETRYMPSGGAVTNLSVATSESWKDKQAGEQKAGARLEERRGRHDSDQLPEEVEVFFLDNIVDQDLGRPGGDEGTKATDEDQHETDGDQAAPGPDDRREGLFQAALRGAFHRGSLTPRLRVQLSGLSCGAGDTLYAVEPQGKERPGNSTHLSRPMPISPHGLSD